MAFPLNNNNNNNSAMMGHITQGVAAPSPPMPLSKVSAEIPAEMSTGLKPKGSAEIGAEVDTGLKPSSAAFDLKFPDMVGLAIL
jgi:hypothetical protein